MDMWIKQCDRGIYSCYVAQVMMTCEVLCLLEPELIQGFYDEQDPVFRGCAGNFFPHDEKCTTQQQVPFIIVILIRIESLPSIVFIQTVG